MIQQKNSLNKIQGFKILGLIWLIGAILDRLWFALDHTPPPWDQADYLNGVMNYWQALQTPQWFNLEWWKEFWLLSSKIPPLTYIITVPFCNLFGTSEDAATLVQLFFSAILLISIYSLGCNFFSVSIGLWAATLCQILPGLYRYRLEFLLDYPLTSIVTFSFCLLILWRHSWKLASPFYQWGLAIAFGISFGLALMIKQTALFFLITPTLWMLGESIRKRYWSKLAQLIIGFGFSSVIFFPWYRTNWLLILTSGKRATLDSAIAEGDPPLHTLEAWLYYLKVLPYLLSWHLLLIPLGGLLIYWVKKKKFTLKPDNPYWHWIIIFLLGGYLISSLNINKDARYIIPLLPVLSLLLAVGLQYYSPKIRWSALGCAILFMLLNIFPLGGSWITEIFSPRVQHYAYLGKPWFHEQVIEEVIQKTPYVKATLGILPSTLEINQHNFSFYGSQQNFQVYGRQVGVREEEVKQDRRSLDWFVTKTGRQGSIPDAQALITQQVENSSNFKLQKSWKLPDESTLKLYHRQQPSVIVKKVNQSARNRIQLFNLKVPKISPPGMPVPIRYTWLGTGEQLKNGLVILTWNNSDNGSQWLQDHGIGKGELQINGTQNSETFQVIENRAMFPPHETPTGEYTLEATYLNRQTQESYPISIPPITLEIRPEAISTPAPELDLPTQFRMMATELKAGIQGLEPIFAQTARINQYDPVQDYLKQVELTLKYRLKQEDNDNLDWLYTVALSEVLQQDVEGAKIAFKKVIEKDSKNPYAYAYLAFIYLYDWQPKAAEKVLETALEIDANIPEIQGLYLASAIMQGNLIKAWKIYPNLNLE